MKVPPWGCPWHGRIDKTGNLHLPNGQTMPYPNVSVGHPYFTYRVRVPGVAPVERDSAELALDADLGREWRDEAILAGTTLHGRSLAGWIYSAPDGTKWDIWTQPSVVAPEKWIEARRFGVLGGKAQVKSLRLIWPTDDLINGERRYFEMGIYTGYVTPIRWRWPVDISPDGSKAIYVLMEMPANHPEPTSLAGFQSGTPLGFQLLSLTGGRDDMAVEVTTLRTFEQTLGDPFLEDGLTVEEWINSSRIDYVDPGKADVNRPWPDPPGTEYWPYEWNPGGRYTFVQGTSKRGIEGRILALWFNRDGEIVECTTRTEENYYISLAHPQSAPKPGTDEDHWGRSESCTASRVDDLLIAGEVVCTYRQDWVASKPIWSVGTSTMTRDDGDQYSINEGPDEQWSVSPDWGWRTDPYVLKRPPYKYVLTYAGSGNWRILTNNVVVFARYTTMQGPYSGIQYRGCATPFGKAEISGEAEGTFSTLYPAGPLVSARFNPYTGEVSDPTGDTLTFV